MKIIGKNAWWWFMLSLQKLITSKRKENCTYFTKMFHLLLFIFKQEKKGDIFCYKLPYQQAIKWKVFIIIFKFLKLTFKIQKKMWIVFNFPGKDFEQISHASKPRKSNTKPNIISSIKINFESIDHIWLTCINTPGPHNYVLTPYKKHLHMRRWVIS